MKEPISARLVPIKGAWVSAGRASDVGRVTDLRLDEGEVRVEVQWLRPNDKAPTWHDPSELRSAFMLGMEVRHLPPSVRDSPYGQGVIRDLRTLGGRQQVLVDFREAGALKWLPFQHLSQLQGVEERFIRGLAGRGDESERLRLRSLAYALELWNENTGALSHLHIDPLPHQLHLVHRILRSGDLNWMIADDVGLGKTIEVEMLLSALKQRGHYRRILIITPPGVMRQWQEELRYKFEMDDFEIYGRDFEINEPHYWKLHNHVIGSMDRFKGDNHLESLLQAEPWDLIVFDEAHRLSRRQYGDKLDSSQRFELAAKLRRRTDAMLLLTATPHQGMQDKFQALLELLRPARRRQIRNLSLNPNVLGDMVIRNNKADVTDADGNFIFKGKTTRAISVDVSPRSQAFDRDLQRYIKRGYQAGAKLGRQGMAIGFVMTVYRKLAASSIAAIHQALLRRRARLQEEARREGVAANNVSVWSDEGTEADERYQGEFEEMAADHHARQFFKGEIAALDTLIQSAGALLDKDQKLQRFIEGIVRIIQENRDGEKILIFTEYRATQSYLERALTARFGDGAVELIHGSQDQQERRDAIARFEDEARFLISTEAGGEGINLQRRCHIMVNYDLPWNPMRIVQRIGRLYRYGQPHRVIVFNVHAPETIDAQVVATMHTRLTQVVADMASLGGEFREGLEDEILGEIADLVDVVIAEILEQAAERGIHRTQERIDEALARAREASARQRELFEYVTGFDPNETRDELRMTAKHLAAFAEAMFEREGIEILQRPHAGAVWEIRLPETVREALPDLRARQRITFDRTWAADRDDVQMLDLDTPLMGYLLKQAKSYAFGGRAAAVAGLSGEAVVTGVLRWQNNHGARMRQEFAAIQTHADGRSFLNTDELSRWLLAPAATGNRLISNRLIKGDAAKKILAQAETFSDRRLARIASADLQPENRQWVSAAWLDSA